jgi:hypothetical protein
MNGKDVVFIGQGNSALGKNTDPFRRDGAAPSVRVEGKNDGVDNKFVKLLEQADGIPADSVSSGTERAKQASGMGGNLGDVTFRDGKTMTEVHRPGVEVIQQSVHNGTDIPLQEVDEDPGAQVQSQPDLVQSQPDLVESHRPEAQEPLPVQQEAMIDDNQPTDSEIQNIIAGEVDKRYRSRIAALTKPHFKAEFKVGYMSVQIPIVDLAYSHPTLLVMTPINNDTKLEPPHKETLLITIPPTVQDCPIPVGQEVELFCLGSYVDIPRFGVRCSMFFVKENE